MRVWWFAFQLEKSGLANAQTYSHRTCKMKKRGKHQDIATHPLFIQMSVHISFCCDQADTICTLTFHLKRKKIEKQKEPATPAKMSCQLLLFNAILQRTWKIRNSHAWKTITQAWCMYIVHSWNDDGLVFSLNGNAARSLCVYSAVCKQSNLIKLSSKQTKNTCK